MRKFIEFIIDLFKSTSKNQEILNNIKALEKKEKK